MAAMLYSDETGKFYWHRIPLHLEFALVDTLHQASRYLFMKNHLYIYIYINRIIGFIGSNFWFGFAVYWIEQTKGNRGR